MDQGRYIRYNLYKESYDENTPFKKVSIIRNIKSNTVLQAVKVHRIGTKTGKFFEEKLRNLY